MKLCVQRLTKIMSNDEALWELGVQVVQRAFATYCADAGTLTQPAFFRFLDDTGIATLLAPELAAEAFSISGGEGDEGSAMGLPQFMDVLQLLSTALFPSASPEDAHTSLLGEYIFTLPWVEEFLEQAMVWEGFDGGGSGAAGSLTNHARTVSCFSSRMWMAGNSQEN